MKKLVVVADDAIWGIEKISDPRLEIRRIPGPEINRERLINADALLTRSVTRVNWNLIDGTPIKFVGSATIGSDHIDLSELERRRIKWVNAPGCNARAVTQWVMAAIYRLRLDKMAWHERELRVGIVGCGQIGRRVGEGLQNLGYQVFVSDPPLERLQSSTKKVRSSSDLPDSIVESFRPLSYLLKKCDVITVHTPLTRTGRDSTLHLLNADSVSQLIRRGASLINTSRGGVIDENGIPIDPSVSGNVVLDVWENEPNISWDLLNAESPVLLASPHVAGYSMEGKAAATKSIWKGFERFFELEQAGITNHWDVHHPEKTLIINLAEVVNPTQMSADEMKFRSVSACADAATGIVSDDACLRAIGEAESDQRAQLFEGLRKNYVFRQEFAGCLVNFTCTKEIPNKVLESVVYEIKNIGFQTIEVSR